MRPLEMVKGLESLSALLARAIPDRRLGRRLARRLRLRLGHRLARRLGRRPRHIALCGHGGATLNQKGYGEWGSVVVVVTRCLCLGALCVVSGVWRAM